MSGGVKRRICTYARVFQHCPFALVALYKLLYVVAQAIEFLGSSRKSLAAFPAEARRTAGHQLERIQLGIEPSDWKPFHSVGPGSLELRVRDSSGEYRVMYVAKFDDAIYVLHAFQKKGRKTARLDVELARVRYAEMIRRRAS